MRLWLDSEAHKESLRLYKAVCLAPDLETCIALLNGERVPYERLDPAQAKRFGLIRKAS